MPVIARIVDRGNPDDPRSDISANEIYGSPVIRWVAWLHNVQERSHSILSTPQLGSLRGHETNGPQAP